MARILKIKNKDGWINFLHFRKCPLCLDFQQEGCGAQAQLRQYSQMFVNFWHNFLGELQRIYREPITMECFDSKCTAHSHISYLGEIYKEWGRGWHGSDGWHWLSRQSVVRWQWWHLTNGPVCYWYGAALHYTQHPSYSLSSIHSIWTLTPSCRWVDISTWTPTPQGCLYLGPSPSDLDNSFFAESVLTSYNFLAS